MTKQEVAVRLLKAIFLEVISIALILIGYVISGGENNGVTTFLMVGRERSWCRPLKSHWVIPQAGVIHKPNTKRSMK